MEKRIKVLSLAVAIVLLGFLRDYFFYNINWVYLTLTNGRPNQALPEFHFLLEWTPSEINLLKWVLTFFFSLFFLGLTYVIIRLEFKNKIYSRITLYSYAILLISALLLYLFSFLIGLSPNLYGVIRTLMGLVQSFMPLMILYILFKFLPDRSASSTD